MVRQDDRQARCQTERRTGVNLDSQFGFALDHRRVGHSRNLGPCYSKIIPPTRLHQEHFHAQSFPNLIVNFEMQEKSQYRMAVLRVSNVIRSIPTSLGIIIGIFLGVVVSQLLSKGVSRVVRHFRLNFLGKRVTRAVKEAIRLSPAVLL